MSMLALGFALGCAPVGTGGSSSTSGASVVFTNPASSSPSTSTSLGATPTPPTTTTAPPCTTTLAGSVSIASQADIDDLAGICIVTGDVDVDAPGLTSAVIPDLVEIDGLLSVHGNTDLDLALPALAALGTGVELDENRGTTSLALPLLAATGRVLVQGDRDDVTVDLSSLASADSLTLGDLGSLSLIAPALADVGALSLTSDAHLASWPFDPLVTADTLALVDVDADPWSLAFPSLTSVGTALSLTTGLHYFPSIDLDLPALATGGDIRISAVSSHVAAHLPALQTLTGSLVVDYDTTVDALEVPSLREAHSIVLDTFLAGPTVYEFPALELLHGQLGVGAGVDAPLLAAIEGDLVDPGVFTYQMGVDALFLQSCDAPVFSLPSLATAAGSVEVEIAQVYGCDPPVPVDVDLSSLASAGYLSLALFDVPATVELDALQSADDLILGGSAATWSVPALDTVTDWLDAGAVSLPALVTAHDVDVVGDADLPALTSVTGVLKVYGTATALSLPALASATDIDVYGDSIASISMPSLTTVGPSPLFTPFGLAIGSCAALSAVDLPALASVDGPVAFDDDPLWCASDASALAYGIPNVTGAISLSGLGGC